MKLKFSLWAVQVTTRRSTGKSPYVLVYGTQALFPTQLAKLVIYFLQEAQEEPNALVRRLNKIIESSENRSKVRDNLITYQKRMKSIRQERKISYLSSRRSGTEMGHQTRRQGEAW